MAKTKTKREEGIELIEDPDLLASKAEEFFNNQRNKNIVFTVGGFIAICVLGFFGYKYYITNQNKEAQEEMFQAVYYFEADSLGKALNGDGINYGFIQISENYSGTKAASLATFYAGASYLKLGDFNNAIRYLKDFSSSDLLVQSRAYALIGDAYVEQGDYDQAVSNYKEAVDYKPNKEFTPQYLQKLALAYEAKGDYASAASAYNDIIEDFFESSLIQEAKKQKARLQGLAAE